MEPVGIITQAIGEAMGNLTKALDTLTEAQNLCQTIEPNLANLGLRESIAGETPRRVELWMASFRHVQSLLKHGNMPPQRELLVFIDSMGEINRGLRDLSKILASMAAKNQGRLKSNWVARQAEHMHLLEEVQSIIRRIDEPFSIVQRFQQTASDLQPFHQRPYDDFIRTWRPPPVAPTVTTQQQVVATELQDEIHVDEIGEQSFKFPGQMVFESGQNFVLALKDTSQVTTNGDELFQQKDGHESLQKWLRAIQDTQNSTKEVNIVVCGHATNQGAVTMKDEAVLLDTLKTLKIPFTSVYRLLDEGIPMLIEHKASPPSTDTRFTFRLPLSKNEDWTLGIYWDPSLHAINAFIHGMQDVERLAFSHKLVASLADIQHPMLLPVILCELLTAGDIASVRGTANRLHGVEKETQWSHAMASLLLEKPIRNVERGTRILNAAISRLPTHEARTRANILLVGRILECISAIVNKHCSKKNGNDTRENEVLWKSTNRLKARLHLLQATQNGLLLEVARECQIASSQLQIVYNLVAQRDNKNNYEMAKISLEIARTTKDDSFAMFTLAVMSILFLPGAFIATLFSMDLFDWSAKDGERVINSRFWMYWVIALPLTLIVLAGWLSWLKMHQKNESQRTLLWGSDTRQNDVPQRGNETTADARASAIEDADVGDGGRLWTRYLRRRKIAETSNLRLEMGPDVGMNNRDGDPSRTAMRLPVLGSMEVPGARSAEEANMEAAIRRSYTFAAQGVRRD